MYLTVILAFVTALLTALYLIYLYFTWHFNHFKNTSIPVSTSERIVPVFGSLWKLWCKDMNSYTKHETALYGDIYGLFRGRMPCISISKVDTLREVLVKHFDSFCDRPTLYVGNVTDNIAFVKGQEKWRAIKGALTPLFTPAKLNMLFEDMNCIMKSFVGCLESRFVQNNQTLEVEMKSECMSVFLDQIGKCAFGLDWNSIHCDEHPAKQNFQRVVQFIGKESVVSSLCALYPNLAKIVVPKSCMEPVDFFVNLIRSRVETLRRQVVEGTLGTNTNMLTVLLMNEVEYKGKGGAAMRDSEVFVRNCGVFLAGLEMTATATACILFELASHRDVQDRLRQELLTALTMHGKISSNEFFKDTPYLDQCVNEGFRLYPVNSRLERDCVENIKLPSLDFVIEKGTNIWIPTNVIHMDPEAYPEPEIFDPERWTLEEKSKRDPLSFMPFGYGPRQCLGFRLALRQIKMCVAHLVIEFEMSLPIGSTRTLRLENTLAIGTVNPNFVVPLALKPVGKVGEVRR